MDQQSTEYTHEEVDSIYQKRLVEFAMASLVIRWAKATTIGALVALKESRCPFANKNKTNVGVFGIT